MNLKDKIKIQLEGFWASMSPSGMAASAAKMRKEAAQRQAEAHTRVDPVTHKQKFNNHSVISDYLKRDKADLKKKG